MRNTVNWTQLNKNRLFILLFFLLFFCGQKDKRRFFIYVHLYLFLIYKSWLPNFFLNLCFLPSFSYSFEWLVIRMNSVPLISNLKTYIPTFPINFHASSPRISHTFSTNFPLPNISASFHGIISTQHVSLNLRKKCPNAHYQIFFNISTHF